MQNGKLEVIATHIVSVVFPLKADEQVIKLLMGHDADEESGNWFTGINTTTGTLLKTLPDGNLKNQILLLRAIADYGFHSNASQGFYSLDCYFDGMVEMQFAFSTPEDAKVFDDGLGNYEVESLHLLSLELPLNADEELLTKIWGEDGEELCPDWFESVGRVTAHLLDTLPDDQLKYQIALLQAVAEYGNNSAMTKGLYLIENLGDSLEMQFEFVRPEDAELFASGLSDYLTTL